MSTLEMLIKRGEKYILFYEFEIYPHNKLFLTNGDDNFIYKDQIYKSNSGISLGNIEFNNSAHNKIKIKGIFDNDGINNSIIGDIKNLKISFYFWDKKIKMDWLIFNMSKFQYNEKSFEMTFVSEIFKMKRDLLKTYSRKCRADFGDNYCNIDILKYIRKFKVKKFKGRQIILEQFGVDYGQYYNGKIMVKENCWANIISVSKGTILLRESLDYDIKNGSEIFLIPGCNKNLEECTRKYNNAINFRGEIIEKT